MFKPQPQGRRFGAKYFFQWWTLLAVLLAGRVRGADEPQLELSSPVTGAQFVAPGSVPIRVTATDTALGWFEKKVNFYANGKLIGTSDLTGSIFPAVLPLTVIHGFTWLNVPAGDYELVASALRHRLHVEEVRSAPIRIHVGSPETPKVWLVTVQPEVTEGTPAAALLLRRSGSLSNELAVNLGWDGSAVLGTDYTVSPATFVFPAGADQLGITLQPKSDTLPEGDEFIVAAVRPPTSTLPGVPVSYQVGEPATAKILLKNRLSENHPPTVAMDGPSVVQRGVNESNRFTATAQDADGKVVVVVFVLDGIRIWADTAPPFEVTIGVMKAGEHTLYAEATDDRNATAVSSKVILSVTLEPVLPELLLTTDDGTAAEADPTDIIKFTLTRTGDIREPLRVYFKAGGTAQQDVDYSLIPAMEFQWCPLCLRPTFPPLTDFVEIPAGSSTIQFGARAWEDSLQEGTEDLTVTLVQPPDFRDCVNCPPLPPAYRINPHSSGKGVILDAPTNVLPIVSVEAVNSKTTEGSTQAPLTFRVSRLAHSIAEDLVVYFNLEGTALYDVDYHWEGTPRTPTVFPDGRLVPAPGQELPLVIPAGQTSALTRILALTDAISEADETVQIRLTQRTPLPTERLAQTYEIGSPDTAKGVIVDATPAVKGAVTWVHPAVDQQFDATADITLEVLASGSTGLIERVEFFANGTQVGQSDFPCPACERFLPPGVALRHSLVWSHVLAGDYVLEAVGIAGTSRIPSPTRAIHVGPPPELPVITLEASGPKTSEPNPKADPFPVHFILKRTGPLNKSVKVYYSVAGTARNGRDYEFLDGDATIATGKSTRELPLTPLADHLKEPDETVVLTLRPSRAYRIGDSHQASVVIVDVPPVTPPPPSARIVFITPKPDAVVTQATTISIQVTATDPKGYFSEIEFLVDGESIGFSRLAFFREPDPGTPITHTLDWKTPTAGKHRLTAQGKSSTGNAARADISVLVEAIHEPRPLLAHPADAAPANFVLTAEEVGNYAATWKKGAHWITAPNPVPIGYVTRGGYLLRSGGTYRFDPTVNIPGLFWVPATPTKPAADFASVRAALTSSDDPSTNPASDLPQRGAVNSALAEIAGGLGLNTFKLSVYVTLAPDTLAWAVEEIVGVEAVVGEVSEGGYFDAAAGVIRWGPFFDAMDRTLTARVTREFQLRTYGVASFDGTDQHFLSQLAPPPLPASAAGALPRIASVQTLNNGAVQLLLVDESALGGDLEISSDLANWAKVNQLEAGQNCTSLLDTDAEEERVRFYRVVRH